MGNGSVGGGGDGSGRAEAGFDGRGASSEKANARRIVNDSPRCPPILQLGESAKR